MRDVEDQLRAYGDSILDGDDVATVSAAPRRRSLVFASAAIVVIAALAGALLVAGDDQHEHSAVRTVPSSPELKRGGPKVTAELHLDKHVVHRGEDVTGTVVFENRTSRGIVLRRAPDGCGARVYVVQSRQPLDGPSMCLDAPDAPQRILAVGPSRSAYRFTVPTVDVETLCPRVVTCSIAPRTTEVALVAPEIRKSSDQSLRIIGAPRVPFCHAADVAVTDSGPADGGSDPRQVHRFLVRNVSRRPCQLAGAPEVWILHVDGAQVDPTTQTDVFPPALPPPSGPGASVVLRRGASAAFLVQIRHPSNRSVRCKPLRIRVGLPDQGGRVDLRSDLDELCISQLAVVSNFTPSSAKHGPKVTAELHLDKHVVHRGEDVIGTVVFVNRSGTKFVAGYPNSQCLPRWVAWIGRTRKLGIPAQTTDCPNESSARVVVLQPGTTRVPLVLPSTYVSCGEPESPRCPRDGEKSPRSAPLLPPQHTKVWLAAGGIKVGPPQALQITGPPRVPFCQGGDVTVRDYGPIGSSDSPDPQPTTSTHEFFVNADHRRCQLVGRPTLVVRGSFGEIRPLPGQSTDGRLDRVVIGPGLRGPGASFSVEVVQQLAYGGCGPGTRVDVDLPNEGGHAAADTGTVLPASILCKVTFGIASDFHRLDMKARAVKGPETSSPVP